MAALAEFPAALALLSLLTAKSIQPFLANACYGCDNSKLKTAELDLEAFRSAPLIGKHCGLWEKVAERLQNGTMPPKRLLRPPQSDFAAANTWIRSELACAAQITKPDPGRVTAGRVNRTEYNNTIHDLLGLDFRPADDFPQDNSAMIVYGGAICDGNTHSHTNLPVILAGHGNRRLKPGRHIAYAKSTPMTNFYVAVLEHREIPTEKFGDSNGKLEHLTEL